MPSWFKGSKKYNKTGDHAIGENFSFVSDVENGEHQGTATMMEETYSHGPAPVTILFGEQNEDFDDVDHDSIDHVDIENHYVAGEGGGRGRGQGGRGQGRDDDGDDFKDEDDAANITQDTIDIGEGEEISFDKSISMRGKSITDLQPIDLDDFCCGLPSSSNNIGSLALASMMTTMMTTAEAAEAGGCVDAPALEGGGAEDEEQDQQQQQREGEGGRGGSGKIHSIQLCSTEDGVVDDDCEETNSAASSSSAVAALDNIRGMGPIRDRGGGGGQDGGSGIDQSSSVVSPMCMKMNTLPSGEKRSKLYWYITVTFICLLLAAIIGTVVAVYGNPKSNNEKQKVSGDVNTNNSGNNNKTAITPPTININNEAEINNNNNTNSPATATVAAANNNTITDIDTTADVVDAKNNITDVVDDELQQTSTNDDVNSITVGSMGDKENGIKAVLAMSVPPPTDFNTAEGLSSSSPQAMAFDWIVNTDEAQLTVETASVVEITERFAAATLYFATGGPSSWVSSLGFLSNDSICNWNDGKDVGIFCNGEGETAGSPTEIKIGKLLLLLLMMMVAPLLLCLVYVRVRIFLLLVQKKEVRKRQFSISDTDDYFFLLVYYKTFLKYYHSV